MEFLEDACNTGRWGFRNSTASLQQRISEPSSQPFSSSTSSTSSTSTASASNPPAAAANTPQLQTLLTDMLNDVFSRFEMTDAVFEEVQHSLNESLALPTDADPAELLVMGLNAITEAMKTGFGWEAPTEIEGEGMEGLEAAFTAFTSVFKITFGYFTICTGLILIFIAVFSLLSYQPGPHHSENRLRYL
ncbi:hypothetical protein BJX99DRAFT_258161 [Aspergillus californicus]